MHRSKWLGAFLPIFHLPLKHCRTEVRFTCNFPTHLFKTISWSATHKFIHNWICLETNERVKREGDIVRNGCRADSASRHNEEGWLADWMLRRAGCTRCAPLTPTHGAANCLRDETHRRTDSSWVPHTPHFSCIDYSNLVPVIFISCPPPPYNHMTHCNKVSKRVDPKWPKLILITILTLTRISHLIQCSLIPSDKADGFQLFLRVSSLISIYNLFAVSAALLFFHLI